MLIKAVIDGDKELGVRLERTSNEMIARLMKAARASGVDLESYIKRDLLSGQLLNVRSGKLRRSIHHGATALPDGVEGRVYSAGVPYARIQNDGGRTSPHVIEARTASVLAFQMGGRTVFAKRVNHPGSRITAKKYMETGLFRRRDRIIAEFEAAAMGEFK